MITVLYDGKCGLCSREIQYYRTIAPDGVFDWRDVTQSSQLLKQHHLTLSQGLKLLHAIDEANKIHVGVDAFILIWAQLAYWRILAAFTTLPIIKPMAVMLYHAFASWRFKRLGYDQL